MELEEVSGVQALLPSAFVRAWAEVPRDVMDRTEHELRGAVKRSTNVVEYARFSEFRIAFWEEVEKKKKDEMGLPKSTINMQALELTFFPKGYLLKKFFEVPEMLAWLLFPMRQFMIQLKNFESLADERILEILSESPIGGNGVVNTKLAGIQVKIYELLQNRLHGAVVQRQQIEQKNLNVNVNEKNPDKAAQIAELTSLAEIDRRIKEIEKKRLALKEVAPIQIDTQQLVTGKQEG